MIHRDKAHAVETIVLVRDDATFRVTRWDRTGVVASEWVDCADKPGLLADLFWRASMMSDGQLGFDATATAAIAADTANTVATVATVTTAATTSVALADTADTVATVSIPAALPIGNASAAVLEKTSTVGAPAPDDDNDSDGEFGFGGTSGGDASVGTFIGAKADVEIGESGAVLV